MLKCPFNLSAELIQNPKIPFFQSQASKKQIWSRIYGHLMHGLTEKDPQQYFQDRKIQVEARLLNNIIKWSQQKQKYKIIVNKPDPVDSPFFDMFTSDKNNLWVYQDDNIYVSEVKKQKIKGVYLDRKQNFPKQHYSTIIEGDTIGFILSAKHLSLQEAPPKLEQFKIKLLTNRFLQVEGLIKDDYQYHELQLETISKIRFYDSITDYWVTDIDNWMEGNPFIK
ncbi:hypothetical protein pb186bvf_013890 [Paramecium bursaria]